MSKFIEVTDIYLDKIKRVLNVAYIREARAVHGHHPANTWIMFGKEEVYCIESFDDIKAMLMYDPAVADIFIKGKELS